MFCKTWNTYSTHHHSGMAESRLRITAAGEQILK